VRITAVLCATATTECIPSLDDEFRAREGAMASMTRVAETVHGTRIKQRMDAERLVTMDTAEPIHARCPLAHSLIWKSAQFAAGLQPLFQKKAPAHCESGRQDGESGRGATQ